MNELELKYNEAQVGQTTFNEEDLRAGVLSAVEKYKGLLVTEDGLKEARADRAKLNKLKDSLNAARMEVKRRYMGPYEEFEKKLKGIISIVDEPILAIDTQIKTFEQKAKEAKQEKIRELYQSYFAGLTSVIPFEKVFRPEFLNATFSIKKVENELEEIRDKVEQDLQTIGNYEADFKEEAKAAYLENLSLGAAMARVNYLRDTKAKLAQIEANKKLEAAAKEIEASITDHKSEDMATEKEYTINFTVTATKAQLMALKDCLIKNHISYKNSK